MKKVYNFEKIQDETLNKKIEKDLVANFKRYLELLSQEVDKCGTEEVKLEKTGSSDEIRPDSKLFRVKPKTKKINFSGEEIENEFEEEEIQNLSNFSLILDEEQDLILGQRS